MVIDRLPMEQLRTGAFASLISTGLPKGKSGITRPPRLEKIVEQMLLCACIQDRGLYERISKEFSGYFQLSPNGNVIFRLLSNYYNLDPSAHSVDSSILSDRLLRGVPSDQIPQALEAINSLDVKTPVSVPNLVQELKSYKKNQLKQRLIGAIDNDAADTVLVNLFDEFNRTDDADEDEVSEERLYHNVKASELVKRHFNDENLIKLWPKSLNDLCDGGARRGHHILVVARTEIGKTLFVQNMVAGFLHQGLKTLYVGNEDPAFDICMRMMCRLIKKPKQWVIDNVQEADELAAKAGYDNFVLADLAPGNFKSIGRLAQKEKPVCIVLDQLRNIDVDSESRTVALEKAATEARNLGKRQQALVVSVTQAGESAEGKAVLALTDVDGSKTGIQGQIDLMIMLGATPQMLNTGFRTANLPKNKLSGKHQTFSFRIDPSIGAVYV